MTDELKQFLTDNKQLLVRNDFDNLYAKSTGQRNLYKEMTEFFYNIAKIDPLRYMTSIPSRMFFGVQLNQELVVPNNIKLDYQSDSYIYGLTAPSVLLDCALVERSLTSCRVNKIVIKDGPTRIPKEFLYDIRGTEKIMIPESVTRIGNDAFSDGFTGKIITPYRTDESKRLIIPKSEISWYKDHLRFTHAPKASEVEDGIKEN